VPQRCLAAQRAEPATPHGALVLEPVATSVAGAGTVGVWRALDRAARASMLSVGSGPTEVGLRADPHRPIGVARTSLPNQTVEGSPAPEPTSPRIVGRRTSDDHGSAEYRAPNSDTHLHCSALHCTAPALHCSAKPPRPTAGLIPGRLRTQLGMDEAHPGRPGRAGQIHCVDRNLPEPSRPGARHVGRLGSAGLYCSSDRSKGSTCARGSRRPDQGCGRSCGRCCGRPHC
jgi:hypothetical protein